MGQAIKEPRGTLTLSVKVMLPQSGTVDTAINQVWVQEQCIGYSIECTYHEAERIASTHRKLNGEQNAVAMWEGSVTL